MAYHTLVVKEQGTWAIHFGDKNREVVKQELEDLCDGFDGPKKKDCKIITTKTMRQSEIDQAVAKLNGK